MKKKLFILLFLISSLIANATTYYVSTSGSDGNAGTLASPWGTWQKAFSFPSAGDIVYIRGGVWHYSGGNGVYVSGRSGTASNYITVQNYPGEVPILDGSNILTTGDHYGIDLENCSYYHIKGLSVQNVKEYGQYVGCPRGEPFTIGDCSHVIIELCNAHDSGDGFAMGNACADIHWLNDDGYNNSDYTAEGDYANGFTLTNYVNTNDSGHGYYIYIDGCRAFNNSDDGFDTYGANGYYYWNNCWAFKNGYGAGGDGDGFKWGANYGTIDGGIQRVLTNCLSFYNSATGIGFDKSEATVRANFYNDVAFHNTGQGFFNDVTDGFADEFKNCISYANSGGNGVFLTAQVRTYDSWTISGGNYTVTSADFVTGGLDTTGVSGPRNADGSLPVLPFMHLKATSGLYHAGVPISGLTKDAANNNYDPTNPSIGAYEVMDGAVVPTVTTTSITGITTSGGIGGGNVTSDGGATVTIKGICYSTSQNPTIASSTVNDGTGTGSFTSTLTGLTPSTTYYVRAYATNSVGTAYGSQVSFTTGTTPVGTVVFLKSTSGTFISTNGGKTFIKH